MRLRTYILLIMTTLTILVFGFLAYQVQNIIAKGVAEVDNRQAERSAELINMSVQGTLSRLASLSRILRANNDLSSAFVLSDGAEDPHLIAEKIANVRIESGVSIVDILTPAGRSIAKMAYAEPERQFISAGLGTKTARPVTGIIAIADKLTLVSIATLFLYDEPVGILVLGVPVQDAVAPLLQNASLGSLGFSLVAQTLPTNSTVSEIPALSDDSGTRAFILPGCPDILDQTRVLTATFHMATRDASSIGARFRNEVLLTALGALVVIFVLLHFAINLGFVRHFKDQLRQMTALSKSLTHGALLPDQIAAIRADGQRKPKGRFVRETKTLQESFATLSRALADFQERIAAQARNEAIARVTQMFAHDVRKPFRSVELGLAVLKKVADPAEFQRTVSDVAADVSVATAAVNGMIQEILEVSADSDVHREPTSLTQLIESAVSEARKLHGDRGIQFEIDIAHQDPISLDPAKIKRMLANIIENGMDALNGSGRLWVKTRQDKTGNIVIEIGNNGPTIPTDEIPFLFEPFFTRRKKSGTGLGLAIARKVVEGHGGQLTCVSSVETSTVFIAKVPS